MMQKRAISYESIRRKWPEALTKLVAASIESSSDTTLRSYLPFNASKDSNNEKTPNPSFTVLDVLSTPPELENPNSIYYATALRMHADFALLDVRIRSLSLSLANVRQIETSISVLSHLSDAANAITLTLNRKKTMTTQVTFLPGSCYNCGEKGHMMRECRAKTCSRCGNSWPSETSEGFHRCYERNKCPQSSFSKGQSGGAETTFNACHPSKRKLISVTSVQSSEGEVTKKQYKAHFKVGKVKVSRQH
jgi:hypothetical protein